MAQAPTLQRLHLGRELRRLREEAGITSERAAAELECDRSKLSRIELGRQGIGLAEVKLLNALYGVEETEAGRIVEIAREAKKRVASEPVPEWLRTLVAAEREAETIQMFEVELVPGLLQTEDYTRAVTRTANPNRDPSEVEHLVKIRKDRQKRLQSEYPPQLTVVMSEAVLRRRVGGPAVMREQLEHLRDVARLPAVSLHTIPFSVGAHAAMGSSFHILMLPPPDQAQVVYLEDLWSGIYVDSAEQLAAYSVVFDRLVEVALDEEGTEAMIDGIMGELR